MLRATLTSRPVLNRFVLSQRFSLFRLWICVRFCSSWSGWGKGQVVVRVRVGFRLRVRVWVGFSAGARVSVRVRVG
jgi:hypothetical protein